MPLQTVAVYSTPWGNVTIDLVELSKRTVSSVFTVEMFFTLLADFLTSSGIAVAKGAYVSVSELAHGSLSFSYVLSLYSISQSKFLHEKITEFDPSGWWLATWGSHTGTEIASISHRVIPAHVYIHVSADWLPSSYLGKNVDLAEEAFYGNTASARHPLVKGMWTFLISSYSHTCGLFLQGVVVFL